MTSESTSLEIQGHGRPCHSVRDMVGTLVCARFFAGQYLLAVCLYTLEHFVFQMFLGLGSCCFSASGECLHKRLEKKGELSQGLFETRLQHP